MSAPERGVSDIYRVSDRILSARSGLNEKQLKVCKKQLQESALVFFKDNYVKLVGSGYVLPKKGRFTEQALEREYAEVPKDILVYFTEVKSNSSLIVEHYGVTIHKDIDKDIDVYKDKDVSKTNTKDIDNLLARWTEVVGYEITSKAKMNRQAVSKLLKIKTANDIERMLQGVALSQEDKYAPRISNFIDLERKWDELIAWGKRTSKNQGISVAVI